MADAFRPLTLLLGAVCLWALSVLILALAGLGSRFTAATGPAAGPPLPVVSLSRSESRLGPITDYLEVGTRPLLTANRRPAPQLAAEGEAGSGDLDVMLTSVLITPRLQMAIFTDNKDGSSRRVRMGDSITGSNWRLVQLEPRRAVIEGPAGQRILDLRIFDGRGGAAPTPVANAGSAPTDNNGPGVEPTLPPPPPPEPAPEPSIARQPTAEAQPETPVTQEEQVEAIRRRIEARRAQMRAEADPAGSKNK